jgi:tRNA nucleotidyltransferase (CCA-adding enzyme)
VEFPLPFSLDCLPLETCVVGGAVRDALLGRVRSVLDLDLVVPVDAVALAQDIAAQYRAGFVLLDAERSIARLVFDGVTVDFAQQMGGSLLADLQRRDYRMNAIAYHLRTQELIDPLDGAADVQAKLVRMVSADNLAADPLRILRGYRQAAQLGFALDPETDRVIRQLAFCLQRVAAERVMTELRYLLAVSHADARLLGAAADLLGDWLPVNRANLVAELQKINRALGLVQQRSPELWIELQQPLRSTLPTTPADIALLCGWLGSFQSQELLINMTMSTAEINAIQIGQQCRMLQIPDPAEVVELYELFRKARQYFPLVVVLWLANGATWEELHFCIHHYTDPQDRLAHPVAIINGSELMSSLSLSPSPLIGQLLASIQLARVQGKISTKAEAITFAQSQVCEM